MMPARNRWLAISAPRLQRMPRRVATAASAVVLLAMIGAPGQAASAASALDSAQSGASHSHSKPVRPADKGWRVVPYRGYSFEVPASWPVISDSRHSNACVRFDLHAVYLGTPPANQQCPSWLVGVTEAILMQPGPASARRSSVENSVSDQITVTAPGIVVTATFRSDPQLIYRIIKSAGLPMPVLVAPSPPPPTPVSTRNGPIARDFPDTTAPPELPATIGNHIGLGFDTCAAPSAAYMSAWRWYSPYRVVGIYIGGANRACAQPNLSASWIRLEASSGWEFIPMYVGPQASFGQLSDPGKQGAAAAADAAAQASRLGFGLLTPLYYDMEDYPPSDTGAALAFESAWTTELHRLGYESGIYSSSRSGVADLALEYHNRQLTMPDAIYDALWNGTQNATDSVIPAGEWAGQHRLHQYAGNVLQTFGGDTIEIDQDYLDLGLTAPGGTTQASPSNAEPTGVANVFFKGRGNHLWEESRAADGAWSQQELGEQLSSPPTVVQLGASNLAVLYRDNHGGLAVLWRIGGHWRGPQELTIMGVLGGGPRAVAQTNGVIDVFWSGRDDKELWHGELNPGQGWSGPQRLGGSLASWPYPVETSNGVVDVLWQGTDSRLWRVVRGVGAAWTSPQDLGMGPMGGPPHAVALPSGVIDVFWRGRNPHSIWSAVIGQHITGPTNLGGLVGGEPWPVLAAGIEAVFYRGPKGGLWELLRDRNRTWGEPLRLSKITRLVSAPFATAGAAGAPLTVFWHDGRFRLWAVSLATHGGWKAPEDLGSRIL